MLRVVFRREIIIVSPHLLLCVCCLRVPEYTRISNFGYPVPEITENAQP